MTEGSPSSLRQGDHVCLSPFGFSILYHLSGVTCVPNSTNNRVAHAKGLLQAMREETEKMKKDPSRAKPSEVRVRENLQNTLTRKFVDLAKDYQNRQVRGGVSDMSLVCTRHGMSIRSIFFLRIYFTRCTLPACEERSETSRIEGRLRWEMLSFRLNRISTRRP